MPTTFRPYEPDQLLLPAPDIRGWLPEGHLAHHVGDLVDGLDLTAFHAPYEGDGRRNAPYGPRMMVKVLLYGYATGVFSSRGMAGKPEEDVAFRVLGAGNFPSHRTLCGFRRRHLEDFKGLFVEVVRVARGMGLAKFGKLSVDGTKVRANASKRKATGYDRMLRREREPEAGIEALPTRARDTDAREDERFGESFRGDELPEELRRRGDRLEAIRAAKERLEAARGGRCARARARTGAQSQGRPAVQARLRGAGRKGAGQLHRPGKRHNEDRPGGVPAMPQRAGGRGRRTPVDRRDGTDLERERPGRTGGTA